MKQGWFPQTNWALIGRAVAGNDAARETALNTLLRAYHPCLRRYLIDVRRLPVHTAEDVLQSFITEKILAKQLLAKANPELGRFRSFLLTCLNNFVNDGLRGLRDYSAKKADLDEAGDVPAADKSGLDKFERNWARRVIELALEHMRAECEQQGRQDLWEIFRMRVIEPALEGAEPVAYDEVIARLHLTSPRQAINLLASSKRVFSRNLRSVIAEYAGSDAEVEQEIADLCAILRA
jgi:hypothetical protein